MLSAATGRPITDATFTPMGDLTSQETSDGGLDGVYDFTTLNPYSGPPVDITVSAPGYASQVVTGVTSGFMSGCEPLPVCGYAGSITATSSVVKLVGPGPGTDAALDAPVDATQG